MNILDCECGCPVSGVWVENIFRVECPTCSNAVFSNNEEQTIHDWNSWMQPNP